MPDPARTFRVPPRVSGGVMLSYRCTNTCRHCLYRCSPRQPDEWLTLEMADRIFEALADEPLCDIHLAGGEPTLRAELLADVIRLAVRRDIRLSYVETNAHWCTSRERATEGLQALKDAGLPAILISVSMFHNEFVPFRHTRHGVEAALDVFGPGRTIVYLAQMYQLLTELPDDGRRSLEDFARRIGIHGRPELIPELYQVIPSGRPTDALRHCYRKHPPSQFHRVRCEGDLTNTMHFHIDHHGDLFTGLCAGLASGSIDDLHPELTPDSHPVFHRLATQGPFGLMEMAQHRHGYEPRADGYVSKCDLCLHVRTQLHATGAYPELRPDSFYMNA